MSDEDLLAQAIAGDERALCVLLRRFGPQTRATVHVNLPPRWRSVLSVDDVMQVTYMNAFLHIETFQSRSCEAFAAWLTRIASNNLHNAIKGLAAAKRPDSRRRVPRMTDDDSSAALFEALVGPDSTPSRRAWRHEVQREMTDAIDRLPDLYQQVVRLYDLEGHSAKEAAVTLNRSEGAVYMLRARAHQRLREELGSSTRFLTDLG